MPADMRTLISGLRQTWPMPSAPRPITLIGAGGIVRDGHLPAYRKMGLPVEGVFDLDRDVARRLADDFGISNVHETLEAATAACGASGVFDLALPPAAILATVERLPENSVALIQKPLGPDGATARRIVDALEARGITAATNFQLRFTPDKVRQMGHCLERGGALWSGYGRSPPVSNQARQGFIRCLLQITPQFSYGGVPGRLQQLRRFGFGEVENGR